MTTAQAEGTDENKSPPDAGASQPQGTVPAAQHALHSPKRWVDGGAVSVPYSQGGACGHRGGPAPDSAQPWGIKASHPARARRSPS